MPILESPIGIRNAFEIAAAVKAAGLVGTLRGDGPFTVFAPTDNAFETALAALDLSADELAPWAGITPEAAAGMVDAVADSVDYLVIEKGSIYSVHATRPDGHTEPGFNLDLVRGLVGELSGQPVRSRWPPRLVSATW